MANNILSPFQQVLAGMFTPQQPAAGASMYDQARAEAQRNAMSRLGMGLVAAAIPQTAAQRVQSMQAALGGMGNIGTETYNAAQSRLMAKQIEQADAAMKAGQNLANSFTTENMAPSESPAASVDIGTGFRGPMTTIGSLQSIVPGSKLSQAAERLTQAAPPSVAPAQAAPRYDEYGLTNEQRTTLGNMVRAGAILPQDLAGEIQKLAMENMKSGANKASSNVGQIMQDFNNGYITAEQRDAAIATELAKKGKRIITNPDGSVEITEGDVAPSAAPFGKELAKDWKEGLGSWRAKAESAASDIQTSNQLLELIDSGVNFGQVGGAFNWLNTQLSNLGIVDESGNTTNTNTYAALVGRRVAEIIKAFGSGTGVSNTDLAFTQRIAAADPKEITPEQARKLLEISNKVNTATINQYQKRYLNPLLKGAETDPSLTPIVESYRIEVPPAYEPPVVYDPNSKSFSNGGQ